MDGEILKGHLDMILLAVVARRRSHGYAIIQEIRTRSGGAFDLPEGTIYPALHRLERMGIIRSEWAVEAGRRRRLYELTTQGQRVLKNRQTVWKTFVNAISELFGERANAAHGQ